MDAPVGEFVPESPGWALVFFPGLDRDIQLRWMYVIYYSNFIFVYVSYPENAILLIGILLNIAHFLILTRKSMRNSSTNVILASLAIHDILMMAVTLGYELRIDKTVTEALCLPPNSLFYRILDFVVNVLTSFFRRSSSWLIISMAVVRALSISLFDNSNFSFLSTAGFGLKVVFIEFFINLGFLPIPFIPYFNGWYDPKRDYTWKQPKQCPDYNPNLTSVEHTFSVPMEDLQRTALINGITINFVPCLLYPIFTFILVAELRRMRKKRAELGKEQKKNRTTKIVVAMTVSFLIAELPQTVAEAIIPSSTIFGFIFLGGKLKKIFAVISYINASSHCIICFGLSSNYRSAIYELLGVKRTSNVSSMKLNSIRTANTTTTT